MVWRSGTTCARNLIRVWVAKYEAGAFDDDAGAADLIQEYEARIAALERLVGKQALELEFLKGASVSDARREAPYIRHHRPRGLSVAEGCRLMGLARSTYYDAPQPKLDDTRFVEAIARDLRRVRGLWLAPGRGCASAPGPRREPQEDPPADARARPAAEAAPALRRHDRQRSRPADLPGPGQGHGRRRPRTSSGSPTSPTSRSRPASSISPPSSMPGHAGWSAMRSAARSTPD